MDQLSVDILMRIEPYTRRPQETRILCDLINFYSTLHKLKEYFDKIACVMYKRGHINVSVRDYNFYDQLVKALYMLHHDKIIYLYYFMSSNTCRVSRIFWASLKIEQRNLLIKEVKRYFDRLLYRPGDRLPEF
jgi:hypothetical protein